VAELPTGTVTFLFTDLEGSTRLWEEDRAAMNAALARHDELLTHAVQARGGHVIKGTGDGVHAVFATADAAIAAAVDAQLGLGVEPWRVTEPLRVRMGLHTGVAEQRGGDYFGPVLNRAARLMAVAHGGQVVVSQATEVLVRDALPEGLSLLDLGDHRLRDLSRPERVFQLGGPGLRSEFAPLRSVDAFPGNLPVQLTSFIGREADEAVVVRALQEARVVTLTGVGGVGKTRLAVQVAAEVTPRFGDGAWLCELAPILDGSAVVEVLASVLGVQPRQGQSLEQSLLDGLRGKELLLVLDNCEHVLGPIANLAQMVVSECPEVQVLATSREGIGISGERMIAVPSLGVPTANSDVGELEQADAVRLFVARARDARSGFALTNANAEAVTEICRRLDGIPLALELAAARVGAMTPQEIATRLDQRFRLLTGSSRATVERHQTLRRMIDWSYELLSQEEQRMLERLAVFAGGFSLDAAEATVATEDVEVFEVLDLVTGLVGRSLVVADEHGASTRYRLLETVRQYAEERLEEAGDAAAIRQRHAEHYVALVEEAGPHLLGRDELDWVGRLEPELDNLRTALAWAVDNDRADLALRLVAPLAQHGVRLGNAAMPWAELALTAPGAAQHAQFPAVAAWAAWAALFRGDFALSAERSEQAFAVQDALGLPERPSLHQAPATAALFSGRLDDAVAEAQRWVDLARAAQDDHEISSSLVQLGSALNALDNAQTGFGSRAGIGELEEAVEVAQRIGNPCALSWPIAVLGLLLHWVDPQRARAVLDAAVEPCRAADNAHALAGVLFGSGDLSFRAGDPGSALRAWDDAIEITARVGDAVMLPEGLQYMSRLLRELGESQAAAVLVGAANALRPMDRSFQPPEVIEWREQTATALRAELGDQRFSELTRQGSNMNARQAARYAVDEARRCEDSTIIARWQPSPYTPSDDRLRSTP
jgi:predicted ATPase/class 3 adenylate cyclase